MISFMWSILLKKTSLQNVSAIIGKDRKTIRMWIFNEEDFLKVTNKKKTFDNIKEESLNLLLMSYQF